MKFKYHLINFLTPLFKFFFKKRNCNFRILMLHNIEKKNFKLLEKNLKILKKEYNFIDPNKLSKYQYPNTKNNLLLTFDDGFKSNFFFAKNILSKLKIKSIFFIISDLLNSDRHLKKAAIKNIFPKNTIKRENNFNTMTWNNVRVLEKMGHVIGTHTKSHLRLSEVKSLSILKEQINSPIVDFKKNKIKKPKFFAYPFGDFHSINKKALNIAKKKYEFIFSGIRGDNLNSKNILFRDNIRDNYSMRTINFFIEGYSDFLYKKFRKLLRSF